MKGLKDSLFKNGFTLAEVLITLGIIGVVAAMTIPTLINQTNQQEWYVAFKKHYSELANATTSMVQDNGGGLSTSTFTSAEDVVLAYQNYMKFMKVCPGWSARTDGCWNNTAALAYQFDDGSAMGAGLSGPGAVFPDGTYFFVYHDGALNCDNLGVAYSECARLYIDVTGNKVPNTLGKDIFEINLYPTKLGIGSGYGHDPDSVYGGEGFGMTGYCLTNKCP